MRVVERVSSKHGVVGHGPALALALGLTILGGSFSPRVAAGELAIGVTPRGTAIRAVVADDDLDLANARTRVLLVGTGATSSAIGAAMRWFATSDAARGLRERFALSAVPDVAPDTPLDAAANAPALRGYPPTGDAYGDSERAEAHYVWRWIGLQAPDLVVTLERGAATRVCVPAATGLGLDGIRARLDGATAIDEGDHLAVALARTAACETGRIAALAVELAAGVDVEDPAMVRRVLEACERADFRGPSPARAELARRLARTPLEVARELAAVYGHAMDDVVYIPAVALIGRLRFGALTGDPSHRADVERIVAPWVSGERALAPRSGSALSGPLVFCELASSADSTRRSRFVELARSVADLGLDELHRPRPSMPFHNEMSDAVFLGAPILASAGRWTGDPIYFDACVRHLRFVRDLVLRADGLYRHSPLDDAAWGRGNGFPALGVAWCLGEMPEGHAARAELVDWLRAHLRALATHQDASGCWHQVVDHSESYRELSATSMIAYAIARGVRAGWLERAEFEPVLERAWHAIRIRVGRDGRLVDVSTGTGKQRDVRAYLDRTAILGRDDRGGAMALLAATEIERWRREQPVPEESER